MEQYRTIAEIYRHCPNHIDSEKNIKRKRRIIERIKNLFKSKLIIEILPEKYREIEITIVEEKE